MSTNRRLQLLSGTSITSPVSQFWELGNLSAMDPQIPNLPLETSAQNPYRMQIRQGLIVASWIVEALPQQRRNRQIVEYIPDNPPPRSPYSLSFIPWLWDPPFPTIQKYAKTIVDNPPQIPPRSSYPLSFWANQWRSETPPSQVNRVVPPIAPDLPRTAQINSIIASWYFTFTLPQTAPKLPIIPDFTPKSNLNTEIIARAWAPFVMPPTGQKQVLSSPPIPKLNVNSGIITGAWAPFILPQASNRAIAAAIANPIDEPPPNGRAFQVNLIPTFWIVDWYDRSSHKSIAVFTPNIPPVVIPGTPAGGYMPYTEVATLGWGAIRAYPQVIFDTSYETLPRGQPEPVTAIPAIALAVVSESEKQRLARFAEAAAAFDLDLVMKYLNALGIDLTD